MFKRQALEIKAYGGAETGPESHHKAAEEEESSQSCWSLCLEP